MLDTFFIKAPDIGKITSARVSGPELFAPRSRPAPRHAMEPLAPTVAGSRLATRARCAPAKRCVTPAARVRRQRAGRRVVRRLGGRHERRHGRVRQVRDQELVRQEERVVQAAPARGRQRRRRGGLEVPPRRLRDRAIAAPRPAELRAPHLPNQALSTRGCVAQGLMADYQVTVITSDLRGAGTDSEVRESCALHSRTARPVSLSTMRASAPASKFFPLPSPAHAHSLQVFLALKGDKGVMGETQLSGNRGSFERNSVDVFQLQGTDVGAVQEATVRLAGYGVTAAWHLAEIEVINKNTGAKVRQVHIGCGHQGRPTSKALVAACIDGRARTGAALVMVMTLRRRGSCTTTGCARAPTTPAAPSRCTRPAATRPRPPAPRQARAPASQGWPWPQGCDSRARGPRPAHSASTWCGACCVGPALALPSCRTSGRSWCRRATCLAPARTRRCTSRSTGPRACWAGRRSTSTTQTTTLRGARCAVGRRAAACVLLPARRQRCSVGKRTAQRRVVVGVRAPWPL